ncbi:2-dehydropantoate 2-reductase [Cnuibacter physcomitrellae]|uniref:2-dehydropantoate 2-reductase n=1 Tax=Cnuibacter physcomitrellae TaxID=1619308 RepID=A0A1X9LNW2_9MICO|nr:oxidoreductase [Cnuibacter physcomitrellae]ARJ06895.1 2-dehydropantoate 2-reductase [Cnuibacter physcomitrellae]GGI39078.1 2-dehydropantoate 2-reductase [Cnuibacter physcomitrellae]
MADSDPRIAVVGPGAIGTTIAALLHEAGRTPLVAGRTAHRRLHLRMEDGETITLPGPVRTDPSAHVDPVDILFLAVKATQTQAAAPWLTALCAPSTVVCVLQNGVEQVETVAPLTPAARILPSVVWFPAVPDGHGEVRLLGAAHLTLPRRDGASEVLAVLEGTRCAVDASEHFTSLAWRKLLQNAAAGVMALTLRRAGVFHRDDIGDLTLAYVREGLEVARAEGAVLDDDLPEQILTAFRDSPADRGTSILLDRENGRSLEWDARNGVIQRRARRHGLRTPLSDVLVPLLAAASDGPG